MIVRIDPVTKQEVLDNNGNRYYYIGVTKGNNPRYFAHGCSWGDVWRMKNSSTYFARAVTKHGFNSFKRIVLKEFDSVQEAYDYEGILVSIKQVKERNCYNTVTGGKVNPMFSEESKIKALYGSIKGRIKSKQLLQKRYYYCALEGKKKALQRIAKQYRRNDTGTVYAVDNNIHWARNILKIDEQGNPIQRESRNGLCLECGKSFILKHRTKKYCSSICSTNYRKRFYNKDKVKEYSIKHKEQSTKNKLIKNSLLFSYDDYKVSEPIAINIKTGQQYRSWDDLSRFFKVAGINAVRGIKTGHPKYKDVKMYDGKGNIIIVPIRHSAQTSSKNNTNKYKCLQTNKVLTARQIAQKLDILPSSVNRKWRKEILYGYIKLDV